VYWYLRIALPAADTQILHGIRNSRPPGTCASSGRNRAITRSIESRCDNGFERDEHVCRY